MAEMHPTPQHTFIVEHLDPELEAWQALEYQTIYRECRANGHSRFLLSGLSDPAAAQKLLDIPSTSVSGQSVEQLYPTREARSRVCLLDPKGEKDISPADAEEFDVFLFGGILGDDPPRGTFLSLHLLNSFPRSVLITLPFPLHPPKPIQAEEANRRPHRRPPRARLPRPTSGPGANDD